MYGHLTGMIKTVRLSDTPPASGTVSRIIGDCRASGSVSYRVRSVNNNVATVDISGPTNDVERVVNWGIMERVW